MEPTSAAGFAAGSSRLLAGTLGVLACHLAALGALLLVYAVLVPRYVAPFHKVFGDFDAELPATTVMVVNLANWLTNYPFVLAMLLVPDVIVYLALSKLSAKWSWLATAWAMSGLLAAIVLLVMAVVAVGLPGATLMDRLR